MFNSYNIKSMKQLTKTLSLIIIITITACGGSTTQTKTETAPVTESTEISAVAEIVIEGNDMMQFNLDKIEVTEGQIVKLTLKHVGQMPAESMGHNWVLLKPGTNKTTFGSASVSAKETEYIPESLKDQVIVYTKTIGGGEETTIEFAAPKVGYYDFICSFPGHYGVMQGSFVVLPR
jgi:azurin